LYAELFVTHYPSNIPTENNDKGFIPLKLVAMETLLQIAQDTGSTELSPRKRNEEIKVLHCWCEVWHHLVETKSNSSECHTPLRKGESITLKTVANITSGCIIHELGTEYSQAR
jgi:hypothetical protein